MPRSVASSTHRAHWRKLRNPHHDAMTKSAHEAPVEEMAKSVKSLIFHLH
jgi:hypothetical protein